MISFNQTFEESRSIRVLVVPIGENCMYDKHFETVSRRRSIPLVDLNKPSDWKGSNSPFKNFDWQSSGDIKFDYFRYDRAAHGPSDFDNFQASRRVLVIIGVINYPELDSSVSSKLEVEMDYYSRRYPNIILRRYFVFNYFEAKEGSPLLELTAKTTALDPYAMVIFPPDRECEGGSMIDVHTQEIMGNVAVKLFAALEFHLLKCEDYRHKAVNVVSSYKSNPHVTVASLLPTWLSLSTHYDLLENQDVDASTNSNTSSTSSMSSDKVRKAKKRINGRMRKWMGDVCLQVCSPIDALEHFNIALSECRSQHDYVWLASALEGTVVAMLTALEQDARCGGSVQSSKVVEETIEVLPESGVGGDSGRVFQNSNLLDQLPLHIKELKSLVSHGMTISNAILRLAETRCGDAMDHYSRSLALCGLEVECALKCARMHETYNLDDVFIPSPGTGTKDTTAGGRREKAMEFIMRAVAVSGLNVQQQIECTLEGAFACYRMKMKRKYAFLLYVSATLSSNSENTAVAHALVQKACLQYGIELASPDVDDEISHKGSMIVASPSCSWAAMRRVLFAHCAHFATENGDIPGAVHCLTTLLRLVGEMEVNRAEYKRMWTEIHSELESDSSQGVNPLLPASSSDESMNVVRLSVDRLSLGTSPLRDTIGSPSISPSLLPRRLSSVRRRSSQGSHSTSGETSSSVSALWSKTRASKQLTLALSSTSSQNGDLSEHLKLEHSSTSPSTDKLDITSQENSQSSINDESDDDNTNDVDSVTDTEGEEGNVKDTRGLIAIPKIAPFVQNLVSIGGNLKRRHRHRDKEDVSSSKSYSLSGSISFDQSMSNAAGFITNIKSQVLQRDTVSNSRKGVAKPVLHRNVTSSSGASSSTSSTSSQRPVSTQVSSTSDAPAGANNSISNSKIQSYTNDPVNEDASLRLGVPAEVQSQLMNVFSSLCSQVPPATSLLLEGVPFLLSLKPMSLQEENAPVKIDIFNCEKNCSVATSNSSSNQNNIPSTSALFYDPFEAKRRKAQGLTTTQEVLWSVNTLCYAKATFANPLAVPVILDNMVIIVEEPTFSASSIATTYELSSVIIPPSCENFTLTLSLRPRKTGPLKLKGIQYNIFNALHTSLVDVETGKGIVKLKKEISPPVQYPRKLDLDDMKKYQQYRGMRQNNDRISSGCSTENEARKTEDTDSIRKLCINVTPEAAPIRLQASWSTSCSSISSSTEPVSIPERASHLQLDLLDGERSRVENLTISNISATLKITDIRITVRFTLRDGDNNTSLKLSTFNSIKLLDFSYLTTQSEPNEGLSLTIDSANESLPLRARLIRNESLLPLLPLSSKDIGLEILFDSECGKKFSVDQMQFEILVEYVTDFEGWGSIASSSSDAKIESDLENRQSENQSSIYIREASVNSIICLSSAVSVASIQPLVADNSFSAKVDPGNEYFRLSQMGAVTQDLLVAGILREDDKIIEATKKENIAYSSSNNDGRHLASTETCEGNHGVDINMLSFMRVFSIEVRNDISVEMGVKWCGDSDIFTLRTPKNSRNSLSDFILPPLTSLNVLISVDDEKLGCFISEMWKRYDDNLKNDKGHEVTAFDNSLLIAVYREIFQKICFTWSLGDNPLDDQIVSPQRSGNARCDPEDVLNSIINSFENWKQFVPHPFDILLSVEEGNAKAAIQLLPKKYYKLTVGIRLQHCLVDLFQHRFSHIEVRVLFFNDAAVRRFIPDETHPPYHDGYSQHSSSQVDLSSCFGLNRNLIVVKGRTCVKLRLADIADGALNHTLEFGCSRIGTYNVHAIARFVTVHNDISCSDRSPWWTLYKQVNCAHK